VMRGYDFDADEMVKLSSTLSEGIFILVSVLLMFFLLSKSENKIQVFDCESSHISV
jgi:hypothetical protein